MRLGQTWIGLAAGVAISGAGIAAAESPPAMTFVTGLINVEDMVRVPGTSWIVAGGLATYAHIQMKSTAGARLG